MSGIRIPRINWSPVELTSRLIGRGVKFNFASGSPDPSLIPINIIKESMNQVIAEFGPAALAYPGAGGLRELRIEVSRYLLKYLKISTNWRNIIITSGAQHAIKLLSQLLVHRGTRIYVENPTFYETIAPLKFQGGKLIGVPITNGGIDVGSLEKIAGEPGILYTIPSCHNPTGTCMDIEDRRHLIDLSREKGLLIVEDDPYTILSREAVLPIRSMSSDVIYVGTLSKLLGPGLRIGFVVAPDWLRGGLERIEQHDFSTSTLTQLIAYRLLKRGAVEEIIEKARPLYRRKLSILLDSLERYMPGSLMYEPKCGFYALISLGAPAAETLRNAIRLGAVFVPASKFFIGEEKRDAARLSVSTIKEENIEDGVRAIAKARSG
ncbi:MAG: PLP-dependent aminotransferase family protein [Thermocladium sp.]